MNNTQTHPLDLVRSYARLTEAAFALFFWWLPVPHQPTTATDDAEVRRMRRSFWQLRRAYQQAVGKSPDELGRAMAQAHQMIEDLTPAFVFWSHAVEELVQEAESRLGPKPGQGALKAKQVKTALTYLLAESKLELPHIPQVLRPLVFEALANFTIDGIVMVLNADAVWSLRPVKPPPPVGFWSRLVDLATRLLLFLARPLKPLLFWLTQQLLAERAPLTPEVRALMATIKEQKADPVTLVAQLHTFVGWFKEHRRLILGIIQVISMAAKEAERFLSASGPRKKSYVMNLVRLFLEDEIGLDPNAVFFPVVMWISDMAVEAVVSIFQRHGLFQRTPRSLPPRSREAAATA